MRIKVVRQDGRIETLSVSGTLVATGGEHQYELRDRDLSHFFTLDGHYDGWGGSCECSEDQANDILESMLCERSAQVN